VIHNQASSEIREQYMVCEKARKVLGWQPAYTMKSALEETVAWYSERFSGNPRTVEAMAAK